jgi:hypothetical protein
MSIVEARTGLEGEGALFQAFSTGVGVCAPVPTRTSRIGGRWPEGEEKLKSVAHRRSIGAWKAGHKPAASPCGEN